MPIYTRTGDSGTTALFGGKRVLKCEELVDVYGSIDELNSWIGLVKSKVKSQKSKVFLQKIQSDLFAIGSTLAGWKPSGSDLGNSKGPTLAPLEERVEEMERWIDEMEQRLPPLTTFIPPGGTDLASHTHIARAIARRVERQAVALSRKQPVDDRILKFLNRLSDLMFMLARLINKELGIVDVAWSGIKRPDVNK